MYTGRPWTMRQYAGFGTAKESNQRYHQLIDAGHHRPVAWRSTCRRRWATTPTPRSRTARSGKVGVAIDSIEDMRDPVRRHPARQGVDVDDDQRAGVAAAAALPAGRRGAGRAGDQLTGTIQNDVLKEYIARGTYIYPPKQSLRLITDIFTYCRAEMPKWNTISISGYHMAEAGATPAQEIAFTLANGIEYVRAAIESGQDVDEFAPRLAFFFVSRTTLLEEVAKFRAARRIWAEVMRDEFGAKNPKSLMLRFHTQTAGVQLTAQQPEVNLVRVAVQALAAVLGGTQSLHTNSFDEAIALPTEKAARLALRTQQVLAYETDVTKTVDPFAGSYAVESMTDDVERAARELMTAVEDLGGAVAAIETGLPEERDREVGLPDRAGDRQRASASSSGSTASRIDVDEPYEPLRVDPAIEAQQADRLARLRSTRSSSDVDKHLDELRSAAQGTDNLLIPDEGGARRPRDRRRGLRRAARGVGRLPAAGRF